LHRRGAVRTGQAPGRPLAWHLGLLCGLLLIPVVALEAFLLIRIASAERTRHEAVARDAARRIAVSLDRGLATLGAVTEVLATSEHLLDDDLNAFRLRLEQVPRISEADIVLRDAEGRVLWTSRGGPPVERDAAAEAAARATGRARFSGLLPGGNGLAPAFAVIVRVPDEDATRGRVLSLRVPLRELDRLLSLEGVPSGMTATITDGAGTILARSRDAERLVGTRPGGGTPPDAPDGWRRGEDADGQPTVLAFARSEIAGWTAWVFMPEADFAAPLRRSLAATGAVALAFVALAAFLALSFARRLTQPISALAASAARGEEAPATTPVREVNALAGAYAAARTEAQRLREVQAELRQVARLNEMGTLAAALAHEINQPLTAAATFAECALRVMPDAARAPELAEAREAVREAAEQSVHAGRIVRRLRDFLAVSDNARLPADLNALVRDAVALALADARQRAITPRFDLAPDLPPVAMDRVQIGQVVVNLVRNAVEAMADAAERDLVVATGPLPPDHVRISVADTGPGLAPEVSARLFAPFVTTKPGGMGVGLAISRGVVEEHGGRLDWAPNPRGGSVFRVTLPIGPAREGLVQEESHVG
jgi:signal transduction histidine kinase